MNALEIYYSQVRNYPLLSDAEEWTLSERIQCGDAEAINQLVEGNLRLAVKLARRYVNRGIEFIDLIQLANLGLIEAAKKFDRKKGRFSTYAAWWVRKNIELGLTQVEIISLPKEVADLKNKLAKKSADMSQKLFRKPEIEELAAELGENPDKIRKILMLTNIKSQPIDPVRAEDDGSSLKKRIKFTSSNKLSGKNQLDPEKFLVALGQINLSRQRIENFLHTLNTLPFPIESKNKEIFLKRFGFKEPLFEPIGLHELSQHYQVPIKTIYDTVNDIWILVEGKKLRSSNWLVTEVRKLIILCDIVGIDHRDLFRIIYKKK